MISVIVPIYNAAQYLPKCIQSIQNQTFKDVEILLVDDGSTDESGQICDRFAREDARIKAIHKPNGGVVSARKTGLEHAQGDYIGFADSDDFVEPEFYERLFWQIVEKDADFVHGGYMEEYGNKTVMNTPDNEQIIVTSDKIAYLKSNVLLTDTSETLMSPSIWAKLYKADFLRGCHADVPEHISYGEDLIFLCRCILESRRFAIIPYAGYHYMIREGSLSHDRGIHSFVQECALYTELCRLFQDYGIYNELEQRLKDMLRLRMITCMNRMQTGGMFVPQYLYEDMDMLAGKRILLYGAGMVGKSYYSQFMARPGCRVVAWADQKHTDRSDDFRVDPERIARIDYDVIVIAIRKREMAEEIRRKLIDTGVEERKIVWTAPRLNV